MNRFFASLRQVLQRPRVRYALIACACVLALILAWPPPQRVLHPSGQLAVQIQDRNGQPLYEARSDESGSYQFLSLTDIPPHVINAFIAVEDRDFYGHLGFSPSAIVRAAWQNLEAGRIVSGGSTITQQLVRIRLQPKRRTFLYKMREALIAFKLEMYLSKDEVLQSYINSVYFGRQAYGIAGASRAFFDKSPHELSLAESALLVGLVQNPNVLDPGKNSEGAHARKDRVLQAMRETGVIDEAQYDEAIAEPLAFTRGVIPIRAPHFVQWLRAQRPEAFDESDTLQTTIDIGLQTEIERIIERKLEDLKDKHVTSAAVVVLDAQNGDLLAMVGSADYFDAANDGAVNVAISPRQPGSALKPFTYALALARGDTAATTVPDIETQFFTQEGNPYIPRNYDFGYHGLVRYREALANSYNIAAVRVLEKIGVGTLLNFLQSLGMTTLTNTPGHYGLALTLGDAEVTLYELTAAYGMFARGGHLLEPRILLSDPVNAGARILDARVAWLISDILSDTNARLPEFGEAGPLNFDRPVAAKTGTTRNSRDNWTIGYTPDIVVGVWVGNADNSPMRETSGVTGAGPIFHDVMLAASARLPIHEFERPAGMERMTLCRLSGKLPTADCPHTIDEWFMNGTEPKNVDDIYQRVVIDDRNGLLATDTCDASHVIHKVFAVFPPELTTWARENGWASPPMQQSPLCSSAHTQSSRGEKWLHILYPGINDSFKLDPLIPDENERVIFQAEAGGIEKIDWYVNGKKVGEGRAPSFRYDWQPPAKTLASYIIEARAEALLDKRTIEILP
jgi:penicillin-binding protein 1C